MTYSGFNLAGLIDPIKMPMAIKELVADKMLSADFNMLQSLFTLIPNVKYKQQVGRFDPDLGLFVGKATQACGTQTAQVKNLTASPKNYAPVPYQIEIKMCESDFIANLGAYELKTKTNRDDLTQTDIVNVFVDILIKQYPLELLRYILLADKDAALTTDSPAGVITPGIGSSGLAFFNQIDGVFKQLNDIVAADPTRKTTITADPNAQATYALQSSTLTAANATAGLGQAYFDAMPEVRASMDIVQLTTDSLFIKHAQNLQTLSNGQQVMYENLIAGMKTMRLNGESLITVPQLDRFIKLYEDNGTKLNDPHRAVIYPKEIMHVAFSGADLFPLPFIHYDPLTKFITIRIEDALDVVIAQDNMVQYLF